VVNFYLVLLKLIEASENEEENEGEDHEEESWLDELNWRRIHPERLHTELWFNLPQEVSTQ
jgi:hypothetical protein